jgi:hypothetical protein
MATTVKDRNGGSSSTSAAVDRNVGLSSSAAVKGPVRSLATSAITLSGEQTVAGVALVSGDRCAVGGQADSTQNGIYIVSTGNWQRSPDFNRNDDVTNGTLLVVGEGSNAGIWGVVCATSPAEIGTTAIAFATFGSLVGYLDLVTAATTYQPKDSDLTAIAALTTTAIGRSLLAIADTAAGRTILALNNVDNTSDAAKRAALLDVVSKSPTGSVDDYASGIAADRPLSILKLTPTNTMKITGIDATGVSSGKELVVINGTDGSLSSAVAILFDINSSSSLAANRIRRRKRFLARPLVIGPGDEVRLRYDGTSWRVANDVSDLTPFALSQSVLAGNVVASAGNGTGAAVGFGWNITDAAGLFHTMLRAQTGTTTTGRAATLNPSSIASPTPSLGAIISIAMNCLLDVLSSDTDAYHAFAGPGDYNAGQPPTKMFGWYYNHTSSTKWQTRTRTGGSETLTAQGPTVVANTPYCLGTFLNGDATRCDFFYSADGGRSWTICATSHSTNIPTSGNITPNGMGIVKSAGTTNRSLYSEDVLSAQYSAI